MEKTTEMLSSCRKEKPSYLPKGGHANLNKRKEAIQDYADALVLQPDNSAYLIRYGDLLIDDQQFTKALKYADKIITRQKNFYAQTLAGKALVGLGDKKSAMIRFNNALNGIYGEPYYQRGLLNLELGRKSDACRDLVWPRRPVVDFTTSTTKKLAREETTGYSIFESNGYLNPVIRSRYTLMLPTRMLASTNRGILFLSSVTLTSMSSA